MNRSRPALRIAIAVMLFAEASFAQERRPEAAGEVVPLLVPTGNTVPAEHPVVTFTSAKEGAVLQQLRNYEWVPLCTAPCHVALDPAGTYNVDGPGMSMSPSFRLRPGASRIETRPGSVWLRGGGVVVAAAGAIPTLMGLFIVGLSLCGGGGDDCGSGSDRQIATKFLLPGLVAVAVGIAMWGSGRTAVDADGASVALGGGVRLGASGLSF